MALKEHAQAVYADFREYFGLSVDGWRVDYSLAEGVLLFHSLLEDRNSRTFASVRGIPVFSGEERMLARVYNAVMSSRQWKRETDFKKSLIHLPLSAEEVKQEPRKLSEEEAAEIFGFVTIKQEDSFSPPPPEPL